MKTTFLLFALFSTLLYCTDVVNDETYYKHKNQSTEIIFTQENLPFAKHTNHIEPTLHKHYQNSFNWELDSTLYLGLLSHRNQVPNGYSSQWPNNRQMNYIGGSQNIDYFCATSWLDTLLYHETAHNYQVNVKANVFSRFLYSIFGNGFVLIPMPFSVPNVMENSFMLEGNAVLNESWHGNGGRLYSGRFKAQTILQAKAGKITPEIVYNTNLDFPYGETYYITGGFYHLYMANKHGLDNLNKYFYQHSKVFVWPQFTNHSMQSVTGEMFESSLKEFSDNYASKALTQARGKKLFTSQFYYQLNSDKDEIFFITNESGLRLPELVRLNKNTLESQKQRDSWIGGKVIKKDNNYYTIASNYTSAFNIHQGLYDSDAHILDSTKSKILHGYLSDGSAVYFDVKSSFSQAQLYIEDKFYAQVNSSVHIDKSDNIYYFKQDAKTRTLYKNKIPLYSYEGFYGIISDVDDDGSIYFVANSKNGSTLYRYSNKRVTRAHEADNILEARLLGNNKVFLSAIGSDEYYYLVDDLKSIKAKPFNTKLFFEDYYYYEKINKKNIKDKHDKITLDEEYNSLLDMHYNATEVFIGATTDGSVFGNINIKFADPLEQNQASLSINRDDANITIGSINYSSKQFFINYSFSVYSLIEKNNREDLRDYGVMAYASIPFMKFAKYYGDLSLSYFQDYETLNREPISLGLKLSRFEKYGNSAYPNYLNSLELYAVSESDDNIYGATYNFSHDLPYEFYVGVDAKYSLTDAQTTSLDAHINTRGVKISNISSNLYDKSQIQIPNLANSFYVKSAGYVDAHLSSVINASKYFFTFPLSLQRESIYTKYRHYEIESFGNKIYEMNELTLGLSLWLVGLNSFAFPVHFEYIHNDDESGILVKDKHLGRVFLGIDF